MGERFEKRRVIGCEIAQNLDNFNISFAVICKTCQHLMILSEILIKKAKIRDHWM